MLPAKLPKGASRCTTGTSKMWQIAGCPTSASRQRRREQSGSSPIHQRPGRAHGSRPGYEAWSPANCAVRPSQSKPGEGSTAESIKIEPVECRPQRGLTIDVGSIVLHFAIGSSELGQAIACPNSLSTNCGGGEIRVI